MQRRLVLGLLIGVIAGLVIGSLLVTQGPSCEEWQAKYSKVAQEGRGGAFTFINQGPTAERLRELEEEQPDGCPKPES